ncbi:MAG TPA: penicillin-binding protein 2 [Baekduia sp.]|nr:penicillin-binding protein 2 [Baekduia sp.]
MNKPISRLYVFVMLMFGVLLVSTTWWTVVRADELSNDTLNQRSLVRSLKVRRGTIRAADGSVIARSVKGTSGVYRRTYPLGSLFSHPIGYSFVGINQSGFEAAQNATLMGERSSLQTTLDQLLGRSPDGDDIVTTLDPAAQRIAIQGIQAAGGEGGSAVAVDPRTGAVKVMASFPDYDPNTIRNAGTYTKLANDEQRTPLVNRALQFGYAPGSTFKVVTSVAGVDTGKATPDTALDGKSGQEFSGTPLANDYNQDFGQVTLTNALVNSVNTAFANLGEDVGKPAMQKYMTRFGFGSKPQLDYPRDAMSASVVRPSPPGRPVPATSRFVDLARLSIGQGGLEATPMQMAQAAAAVANGGELMKPHITRRVVDRDGRTLDRVKPERQATVMSKATADSVGAMMVQVVQRGTGTKAQIPGIEVAGKTGTAETEKSDTINDVWFIGFAPAKNPRVAVAVTIKGVVGFGGDFAAPIAKQIMQELLGQ